MAIGMLTSPQINLDSGLTMGEDVAAGCAYKPSTAGVLSKCGTSDTFGVYPTSMADSGATVSATFLGCVTALVGAGGVTALDPVTYGINGTIVLATEGTDHIVGHVLHTAVATAMVTMVKTG